MKNLYLILLTCIMSVNVFSDVDYSCNEFAYDTSTDTFTVESFPCSKDNLASVDATEFNSNISLFNTGNFTNYFYTNLNKYDLYFADDEIFEGEEDDYTQLSLFDNDTYEGERGSGFYGEYYSKRTFRDDTTDVYSYRSVIVLFGFQDDTQIVKTGDFSTGFKISNSGTKTLSTINIGNDTQACEYTSTDVKTEEYETFTLKFNECPVNITAVNSDTNEAFEFYSSLTNIDVSFTDDKVNDIDEDEDTSIYWEKRELLNSDSNKIGYFNFNLYTAEYYLTDNNNEKFAAQ